MAVEHTKYRPRAQKIVYEMLKDHNQKYSRPECTTINDVFTDRSTVRLYKVTKLCDMVESLLLYFGDKEITTSSNHTIVESLTRALRSEGVLVPQDSGHWSIKKNQLELFSENHIILRVPDRMLQNIFQQDRFAARALTGFAADAIPVATGASAVVQGAVRECMNSRTCTDLWGAWDDGVAQGKHTVEEKERREKQQKGTGCSIC